MEEGIFRNRLTLEASFLKVLLKCVSKFNVESKNLQLTAEGSVCPYELPEVNVLNFWMIIGK